jgi:hypothetical protein
MPESQLFLEWTAAARREGELIGARRVLLRVLDLRFPGGVTAELRQVIVKENRLETLNEWFTAAIHTFSVATFSPLVLGEGGGAVSAALDCDRPLFVDAAKPKRQARADLP